VDAERVGPASRWFNIEQKPSKPTFSRVLNMVKAEAVTNVIIEIMKEEY
jgi:hypothetical protein